MNTVGLQPITNRFTLAERTNSDRGSIVKRTRSVEKGPAVVLDMISGGYYNNRDTWTEHGVIVRL